MLYVGWALLAALLLVALVVNLAGDVYECFRPKDKLGTTESDSASQDGHRCSAKTE